MKAAYLSDRAEHDWCESEEFFSKKISVSDK